jgi:hypothetical protein
MKIKRTLSFELSKEEWDILNHAQSLIGDISEACQNFEDDFSHKLYKHAANAYEALDDFCGELELDPTQKIEDTIQY